jgi:glycine oxidase
MYRTSEILIVGGGVIGLSIARELSRSGVQSITVVERGRVGREASYAAAGMLAPNAENEVVDDFYRFCDASRSMFPEFADELFAETGIDIELDRSGTLFAAFTDADSGHLGSRYSKQVEAGIPVERLTASETLKVEPFLAGHVRESLFFPNDWQVENRKLLGALRQSVENRRVTVLEHATVAGVEVADGKGRGVILDDGRISADIVVLATGAWTSLIKIADVPVPFDVVPIRGQMVGFDMPRRLFRRVIYSPRGYLVPRADGRILAGATVEDVGFDKTTTDEAVAQLHAAAAEIAPALADREISHTWAGLRPFATDGLPIIGAVPGYDKLFVATAHYRNGILLAPITAKIIAERIIGGAHPGSSDPFGPERMINRELNANA